MAILAGNHPQRGVDYMLPQRNAFCRLEKACTELLGSGQCIGGEQSWWVRKKSIWKARLRAEPQPSIEPTSPEHTRCRPTNPPILPAGRRTLCISAERLCRWCPRRTATPITLSLAVGGHVHWLIVRRARMSYWMFGRTSGLNTSCFRQTDWPLAFDISVAADCHWFTIMFPGHIRQVCHSGVTRRWRDVETRPDTGTHYA